MYTDPEKQFAMLIGHIQGIRSNVVWEKSSIIVFVEHNLGFEVSVAGMMIHVMSTWG
jgi:hypothetical protein